MMIHLYSLLFLNTEKQEVEIFLTNDKHQNLFILYFSNLAADGMEMQGST